MITVPTVRLRVKPAILPVNGRNVEMQASDTHIQFRLVGDTEWTNVVALTEITGPQGPSIEVRSNGTHLQWSVQDADSWTDIIPLADITGPAGPTGATGAQGPAGADGEGVPVGGTSGQVLAKASGTNYDTEWVDSTGATLVFSAIAAQETPPGSPSSGDTYLVTAPATGAWAAQEDKIAIYNGSSWDFTTAVKGMLLHATDAGARRLYSFDGSAWVQVTRALASFCDEKAQGTASGTFTAGAWQTRDLNTIIDDPHSVISLSSNQFTPAVDGEVKWSAPCTQVDSHVSRLYCVTDAAVVQVGTSQYAPAATTLNERSEGVGRVEAGKAYRIEHRCQTTFVTHGFGFRTNIATERYTLVTFESI